MRKDASNKMTQIYRRSVAFVLTMVMLCSVVIGNIGVVMANDIPEQEGNTAAVEELLPQSQTEPAQPEQAVQPDEPDGTATPETETPQGTEEAEVPQLPEETEAPQASDEAEMPQAPEKPEAPQGTEQAEVPQAPEEPEAPQVTDRAELPQLPVVTEVPQVLDEAEAPQIPEEEMGMEEGILPENDPFSTYRMGGGTDYSYLNRYETSINLEDRYTFSASFADRGGNLITWYPMHSANEPSKIKHPPFVVHGDQFFLGTNSYTATDGRQGVKQVVAGTTKFRLDFRRPFVIEGLVRLNSMGSNADGIAFALHNDKNFVLRNSGGSFGVYQHPTNENAKKPGLSHATVMEVDTFWNSDAEGAYAEPRSHQPHMSIIETIHDGQTYSNKNPHNLAGRGGLLANSYLSQEMLNGLGSYRKFQIEWKPGLYGNEGSLTFTYDGMTISVPSSHLVQLQRMVKKETIDNKPQDGKGYFTIAASMNQETAKNQVAVQMTRMQYTDVEPEITVQPQKADDTDTNIDYVVPGYQFTVMTNLKNIKKATEPLDDFLHQEKMMPQWEPSTQCLPVETAIDYYKVDKKWYENFSKEFPLYVEFRSEQHSAGVSRYRYETTAPDTLPYGSRSQIDYEYWSGEFGMTQIHHKGAIPVRAKNNITSNGKQNVDVIVVNSVDEISRDKLWENIEVDSSGSDSYVPEKIGVEQATAQDMNIRYEYYVDGRKLASGEAFPTQIQSGVVYALKVTIQDAQGDERLENSVMKVMCAAEHHQEAGDLHLFANNATVPISETVLNKTPVEKFKQDVLQNTSAAAYTITKDTIQKVDVMVNFEDANHKWTIRNGVFDQNKGVHTIAMYAEADGKQVTVTPTQEVTENTWSYDDGNGNNTDTGTPGYIIIPRYVELKQGENNLYGEAVVRFAGYDSGKVYTVTAGRTVTMESAVDSARNFDVTVQGTAVADHNDRVLIGDLSMGEAEKHVRLQSERDALDKIKQADTWKGHLTFYIEQKP